MTTIEKDVLVIGAGLTGLTTAFYLAKNKVDFLVIEKKERVGGVIQTETEGEYILETGPNTGVVGHPEVADLFTDLEGKCEIDIPGPLVNKRYILKAGIWEPLPNGLWKGIRTPLFSTKDKFRILGEPFRAPGKDPDESLAGMVLRRMGKSFLDYAIDPFIAGVYAGDPAKLVTRYALPKLYNLEQTYGSFIGGSIKKSFQKKTDEEKKATRKVFSAKGGLSQLTKAMYTESGSANFILGASGLKIEYKDGCYITTCKDQHGVEKTIKSRKLITTTGAFALSDFMTFLSKEQLAPIVSLTYANVVEATLGFEKWDGMDPDGFGGLIPSVEKRSLLGVLFMSTLFQNRTPKNGTTFTLFMGGMRNPELFTKTEEELRVIIEKEFMLLMNPSGFNPELFKIYKHQWAIPQYGAESGARFEQVNNLEKLFPGLIFGGNLKDGIGMADRIKQGKALAMRASKS
jgi:oxygen-dependent protoporphyrinogen oxidase